MSWASSILVGALTAVVGLVASGVVASLAVGWYRISSFEAGSAAFVIGLAILGLAAGFLVGLVTSRVIGDGGMLRSFGVANGSLLALIAVVGVSARLLADVPPTLDGEPLMLTVELRWPDGEQPSVAASAGEPFVRLASVTRGNVQRATSRGPLYVADAHLVDGRWVAPGAVDLFTTRGRFVLDFVLDSASSHGFLIPFAGRPGRSDLGWTEWYPHARPGAPPLPDGFTYRYRVQPRSTPVRIETYGPFEVATVARYFFDEQIEGVTRLATMGSFVVRHRGTPVPIARTDSVVGSPITAPAGDDPARDTLADAVAAVGGDQPALLAHFPARSVDGPDLCYLLRDTGEQVAATPISGCAAVAGALLTNDDALFRSSRRGRIPRGTFDRQTFATPGLYRVGSAIVDTRRLAVHEVEEPDDFTTVPDVPPLGVSPDERSIVRFGYAQHSDELPVLLVTDVIAATSYTLPIDAARMRFATLDALDPGWVLHHFRWQRDAAGVDRLVERPDFVPIPYHGSLTIGKDYSAYRLEPARESLRDALIAFLVSDMHGEPVPVDSFAYDHPVRIDGQIINVAYGSSGTYVSVTPDRGASDMTLLRAVAARFDAALATGKYDAMFGR